MTATAHSPFLPQKLRQERKQAIDDLEAAESELSSLRGALARAREGEEAERLRSQRESQRVTTLKKELEASESRQKNQEEEIALVRKQVRSSFCASGVRNAVLANAVIDDG